MVNIPFNEAKDLLKAPLICRDFGQWIVSKKSKYIYELECGLINEDELATSLHLKFTYFYHPITKKLSYTFSVYKKQPYGLERVFQLEINKFKKIKDLHKKSHQHFGNQRTTGESSWDDWDFGIALDHFLEQTNIRLIGHLGSPEDFNLYAR